LKTDAAMMCCPKCQQLTGTGIDVSQNIIDDTADQRRKTFVEYMLQSIMHHSTTSKIS